VKQVCNDREKRGFLAAVLGRGRGEGGADLAVQGAARPQAARLVEEGRHLRRHASVAGRRADDDGVVVGQFVDGGDRRLLVELEVRRARDVFGHRFGHPLEFHRRPSGAGAVGHRLRHLLDVAIRGVIQNQNLSHALPPL
jgi:hypothetical protein